MDWFYSLDDQPTGPVNDDQFNDLVRAGVITPQTHVWHAGMTDWQFYQPTPPAVPTAVSNREEAAPDSSFKAISFNASDLERAVAKAAAAAKAEEALAAGLKKAAFDSALNQARKAQTSDSAVPQSKESLSAIPKPLSPDSAPGEMEKVQDKGSPAANRLSLSRPPKITIFDLINTEIKKIKKQEPVPDEAPVKIEKKSEPFSIPVENTEVSSVAPIESAASVTETEKEKTIPSFQTSDPFSPIESESLSAPASEVVLDAVIGEEKETATPVPPSDLSTLIENHELVSAVPDVPFDSSAEPKEKPLVLSSRPLPSSAEVEKSRSLDPASNKSPDPSSHPEKEPTALSILSNSLSALIKQNEALGIRLRTPVDPVVAPKEAQPISSPQPLPSSLPVENGGLFDSPADSSLELSVIPIGKPFMPLTVPVESKTAAIPEEASDLSDSLLLSPVLSEDWESFSVGPAAAPHWVPSPKEEPFPDDVLLPYASVELRSAAKIIDFFLYAGLFFVILVSLTDGFFTSRTVEPGQVLLRLAAGFVFILGVHLNYQTFFLTKYGDTVGKMILGLKVVRSDGGRLTFLHAFFRAWGEVLSWMTLGVGYLLAVKDIEKRALHDRLCATRVIKTVRPEKADGAKNNQASHPTASD
jgi:uncharacterized RDD family membrane protein YckC